MGAVVSIDYGELKSACTEAKRAISRCEDYIRHIENKVTKKVSSLTLGGNSNTGNANYFAQKKINQLNQQKNYYNNFMNQVDKANRYAAETDAKVEYYIRNDSKKFRDSHDMKVGIVEEFFTWMTTTLLNETEFGRFLNQLVRDVSTWIDNAKRKFKEWYELKGGKYILKTVIAVIGAIGAAIALVFVAWPALLALLGQGLCWSLIVAAAGVVTAVVAVLNGITKAINSAQAWATFENDPGWAKRYSGFSSFADYLRKNYFNCPFMDKISGTIANVVDVVETVAAVINVADLMKTGIKGVARIREEGINKIFDKVRFSNKGKMTWGTFKHGVKRAIRNAKIAKKLFTTTNYSRLTTFVKGEKKLRALFNVYKALKSTQKTFTTVDKIFEKGVGSTILDVIKEKIQGISVAHTYWKTGKDAINKSYKTYNYVTQ